MSRALAFVAAGAQTAGERQDSHVKVLAADDACFASDFDSLTSDTQSHSFKFCCHYCTHVPFRSHYRHKITSQHRTRPTAAMAHDHHAVKMSKAQKKRSFQRHKRAQFDHIVDEKREAAAIRKELKKEARKEKMEKRRKGYEARDKDVQVAPAAGPDSLTATAPRPPLPQPQQQQMTTAPTAVITIATSTSQQGRSAPVARPGWIIAPVQVHMNEVDENEADKELAAHRVSLPLYPG